MQKPILFPVVALFASLVVSGSALSSPAVGLNPSGSEIVDATLSQSLVEKQKLIEIAWGSYIYCGWFTDGSAPRIRRDRKGHIIQPSDFPTDEAEFRCITVQ